MLTAFIKHLLSAQLPDLSQIPAVNPADTLRKATETIIKEISSDPDAVLNKLLESLIDFGLKLIAAILIYIIGLWLIRKAKKALVRIMARHNTEKTLASFLSSMASILLTITLIIFTISALGINTTSIAAILGAGAVAIGMAFSSSMENLAGGLIILIFKPFKAGDYISINGYAGIVNEVTIVNTKIVTLDNRVVIIPNGQISNGAVDNYSHMQYRRVDISATVEYGSDAQKCMEALLEIARTCPMVLSGEDTPAPSAPPSVSLNSLNDSNVEFRLKVWVNTADYLKAKNALNCSIYTDLPKYGFQFAYPHMDVTLKN